MEKQTISSSQPAQNNTDQKSQQPTSQPERWSPKKHHLSMVIFIVTVLLGLSTVFYIWRLPPFSLNSVYTNNAYVRGQITLISPKVSGYIKAVPVQDFEPVKKEQTLVIIDPETYLAKVAQAEANLKAQQAALERIPQTRVTAEATLSLRRAAIDSAKAQFNLAAIEQKRVSTLYNTKSISKRELDQANNNYKQANLALLQAKEQFHIAQQDLLNVDITEKKLIAAVDNAKAALVLAQQDLKHTVISAPENGRLSQVSVRVGQYVSVGAQLLYLVSNRNWIIANFREADTERICLGQKVSIFVDALGGKKFIGRVTDISPATASEFSLIKADSGTGNFVKIAQRIPIKIEFDPNQEELERIIPGMSVEVEIDVN
ncbi:secretion protein HlyD [Actinobacillus seminis]|uniref:Membrane-fusion protein n=1 Tax=Actinobacillus seminis TaxID=722 RepID=A0A263HFG3_9PAST|nr:HlyD family secretion protein [Actinobacillus seminis]OZN25822.1 secretion protein HlyD [Actinobacillus seminis]SUU34683.1 membrane-fusion protein [Actinobacillus seminis]